MKTFGLWAALTFSIASALIAFPTLAEAQAENDGRPFGKLLEEWNKSFIFDDATYSEIFMGLQMIGDAYLIAQYEAVSTDDAFKQKLKRLRDDGLEKIKAVRAKSIPYILSDLISNSAMRRDASLKYKKLGWNVPIILLRSTEARDQAIRTALLTSDIDEALKDLQSLRKKMGKEEELSELAASIDELIASIEATKKSEKN